MEQGLGEGGMEKKVGGEDGRIVVSSEQNVPFFQPTKLKRTEPYEVGLLRK